MKKSLFLLVFCCLINAIIAQQANISQENRTLKTYPFSDPNPVPILTNNPKIYPYFKYEGYSHDSKDQDWKVVKLENDYIEVYVLPEVGGKVWGAIEKSTGKEFIYRNEVMKFRNISMRGPWTSGGIEFNFGIIGHHPSTATPVDYTIQKEADGSVSCTVGNIDLPSRTQWRVTIRLPKDKAAFETEALWYNPTAMNQSYYNWMTGAAPARSDFEFFTPGDELLKHSGAALPWPIDEMGRNIALYKENKFGPSKSYHIVGEYNDFFGGYYHDAQYGFGHWGEYEAIPGQKLWLWALSRSGGIWEDLLTDTDGQYIEFQAGRQFLQYQPGGHNNPQTQANFEPYSADQWREVWFPIKEIGGLSDVSEDAVMNVKVVQGQVQIGINSFVQRKANLIVQSGGKSLYEKAINLAPMQVFTEKIDLKGATDFSINIPELDLYYTADPDDLLIEKSFHADDLGNSNSNEKLYQSGWEDLKYRLYSKAKEKFQTVLAADPYHINALLGLGELCYRQGLYEEGLVYANRALKQDIYHAKANYISGILYRGKGDYLNAKEAFGWAARSMEFRSNAFAQLGELLLIEKKYDRAIKYAKKALDFNRYNINALQVHAIAARQQMQTKIALKIIAAIEKIDPLNHFAKFERYLLTPSESNLNQYKAANRSELAYQTYLELAIDYFNKGEKTASIKVLEAAPSHAIIDLWWCYIQQDTGSKYLKEIGVKSPELVFPYRRETLAALKWAQPYGNWKLKYYYALNLWGKDRKAEAAALMQSIENQANYAPFYVARAAFLESFQQKNPLMDLKKAQQLGAKDWRTWQALIRYYLKEDAAETALEWAKKANAQFPDNYAIGMDYAKALNQNKQYEMSIDLLKKIKVLPFEGASAGRRLYAAAYYNQALKLIKEKAYKKAIPLLESSKEWPENLGVGKPFNVDERLPNYLLAHCYEQLGQAQKAMKYWNNIADYSKSNLNRATLNHFLGLKAIEKTAGKAKAKTFLQTLLNSTHKDAFATQWSAARFLKNTRKEKALLPKSKGVRDFLVMMEVADL